MSCVLLQTYQRGLVVVFLASSLQWSVDGRQQGKKRCSPESIIHPASVCHWGNPTTMLCMLTLGVCRQQHFANIAALLEITMCRGSFNQGKGVGNDRTDLSLLVELQQGVHHCTQHGGMPP